MLSPARPETDLGLGIGLRAKHAASVLSERPDLGFFEIISENYLGTGGRPLHLLDAISEHYPIVMHGVSMSIGSTDPLDFAYLAQLKSLAQRVDAAWISDHICFTGVAGLNTHDLLPIPYTDQGLAHVIARVNLVQDFLEQPMVFENPSSYATFRESTLSEAQFLTELCRATSCRLLIDVNNVYVSAFNHDFDAEAYVDQVPAESVLQVHLAGHADLATHRLDTHDGPVIDPVWKLYERLLGRTGLVSTLLEWDASIPPLAEVVAEVRKADRFRQQSAAKTQRYAHAV
jgi:hypothetical protein